MFIQKRKIVADDEIDMMDVDVVDDDMDSAPDEVMVDAEAQDLLFEAQDVAELIAEVVEMPVEVTAEDTTVTFAIGDDEYVVEADGDEEILEARRPRGRRVQASQVRRPTQKTRKPAVKASVKRPTNRKVQASKSTKVARRVPKKR